MKPEADPRCITCEGPVDPAHVICDRCVEGYLASTKGRRAAGRRDRRNAEARDFLRSVEWTDTAP